MAQRIFICGELVKELAEDGVVHEALKLADGTILSKRQQHPAEMAKVGTIPGKGDCFDWLDTTERAEKLKGNAALLGNRYEDLSADDAEYILEVNVPAKDELGNTILVRKKVAEAKSEGVDTDKAEKIKPHEWSGLK